MPHILDPIDALIRRVHNNRQHPNRRLDVEIARALYGAETVYQRKGDWWRITQKKRSFEKRQVASYCANQTAQRVAVTLLRRRKRGEALAINRKEAP